MFPVNYLSHGFQTEPFRSNAHTSCFTLLTSPDLSCRMNGLFKLTCSPPSPYLRNNCNMTINLEECKVISTETIYKSFCLYLYYYFNSKLLYIVQIHSYLLLSKPHQAPSSCDWLEYFPFCKISSVGGFYKTSDCNLWVLDNTPLKRTPLRLS